MLSWLSVMRASFRASVSLHWWSVEQAGQVPQ
jgi:hypothetical protein